MNKKFLISILSLVILSGFGATLLHAQTVECNKSTVGGCTTTSKITLSNPFGKIGDGGLLGLLDAIIKNIILPLAGVLVVLAFIYAGFLYVLAQGDSTKVKKAHTAFLYTVVGTVLLLGAYVIQQLIEGTINQFK